MLRPLCSQVDTLSFPFGLLRKCDRLKSRNYYGVNIGNQLTSITDVIVKMGEIRVTCTVALGSHAMLMNNTSLRLNPVPHTEHVTTIKRI